MKTPEKGRIMSVAAQPYALTHDRDRNIVTELYLRTPDNINLLVANMEVNDYMNHVCPISGDAPLLTVEVLALPEQEICYIIDGRISRELLNRSE